MTLNIPALVLWFAPVHDIIVTHVTQYSVTRSSNNCSSVRTSFERFVCLTTLCTSLQRGKEISPMLLLFNHMRRNMHFNLTDTSISISWAWMDVKVDWMTQSLHLQCWLSGPRCNCCLHPRKQLCCPPRVQIQWLSRMTRPCDRFCWIRWAHTFFFFIRP